MLVFVNKYNYFYMVKKAIVSANSIFNVEKSSFYLQM